MGEYDMKVGRFWWEFVGGNVELWYCGDGERYELRYGVGLGSLGGVWNGRGLWGYDGGDGSEVVDVMLEGMEIGGRGVVERD